MSLLVVVRSDERVEALLRWASCFTEGNFDTLHVLDCRESEHETVSEWKVLTDESLPRVSYAAVLETLDAEDRIEVQYMAVKSPDAYAAVMREQQKLKPKLLLLDRNQKADTPFEADYIERLMTDVSCAVMVVRLGGTDGTNTNILVPAAGGSHSRRALKMIHKSADISPTVFFVEPDADEVSLDVGYKRLSKIISNAGIPADEMKQKAVIAFNISKAIVDEVGNGDYGMLLLGATDGSKLRRKLFGTISDSLLQERDGTAVAVIRAERPVRRRIKDTLEKALSLTIPQLNRDERVTLFAGVEDKSRWSFDFAALMVLATAIAALGLLADSGAVVIGAMLVAPLMTPLLGAGLALVQGNLPLWKQCQKSVLLGFVCALVVGLLCGVVAKVFGIHVTGELLARGNPTALDLGIAFISGVAASYCLARPKLSGAMAGVAIAAALVPPIATTGICFVMGELEVVKGSALLFGTNVVAIILGAASHFYVAVIHGTERKNTWGTRLFIIFAIICIGLSVPLTSALYSKIAGGEGRVAGMNVKLDDEISILSVAKVNPLEKGEALNVQVAAEAPLSADQLLGIRKVVREEYGEDTKIIIETRLIVHE